MLLKILFETINNSLQANSLNNIILIF